jgi:hypothetical protein
MLNVVAEYKGVQIALTTDCQFKAVGSELKGGKYSSLKNIKKAIDNYRIAVNAPDQVETLLALDEYGNKCEITGHELDTDGNGGSRLAGLPNYCNEFYPRMDWIAAVLAQRLELATEWQRLGAERQRLTDKLNAVKLSGDLGAYVGLSVDEEFDNLLIEFERKRKLAEAGPDAIPEQQRPQWAVGPIARPEFVET